MEVRKFEVSYKRLYSNDTEFLKQGADNPYIMTLESQTTNVNKPDLSLIEWTSTELRDDFLYLLDQCRTGERTHEMIRVQVQRIGEKIAEKFYKYKQPGMCKTIPTIFTSLLHKHEIHSFDHLIHDTFKLPAWIEVINRLEQSYSSSPNEYKNLLEQFSKGKSSKDVIQEADNATHTLIDVVDDLPPEQVQNNISKLERITNAYKEKAIKRGIAVPPSEYETEQTQTEAVTKKEDQVKTPEYKIQDVHKRRQAIVADGLVYFEERLRSVREEVLPKTPIESDEQAERWRDALMKNADNFAALGDNKHRMDYKNWAETFTNIEKYGPEKGLKMSGYDITAKDLDMIDENTLPLSWNEKFKAVELSYISKEHLDSKGHIIANIFIDLFNTIPAMAEMSEMFSYQAKLRGIRALQVSRKLSGD